MRWLQTMAAPRGYIARATAADAYNLHVLDSLAAYPMLAESAAKVPSLRAVDVGSGAGSPGVPLAISLPQVQFCLLEPRRGRFEILFELVDELALGNVSVIKDYAANMPVDDRFDIALARALAPPMEALRLCREAVTDSGTVILYLSAAQFAKYFASGDRILRRLGRYRLSRAIGERVIAELGKAAAGPIVDR